jgi:hypothetical protein
MVTFYPRVRAIFEEYFIILFIPQVLRSKNLLTLTAFRFGSFKTCNDGRFWSLASGKFWVVEPFEESCDDNKK